MAEVLHWLDSREDQEIKTILEAAGVPAALDAWESSQYRTDRAVDEVVPDFVELEVAVPA
jgi:hypothetical protein